MNSNVLQILTDICNVCLVPILAVVSGYIIALVKKKTFEINENITDEKLQSYIYMLGETISNCVIATNQTYVSALKDKNMFDEEAQKEAFRMTYEAVNSILTDEARKYLALAYKDLDSYITEKIESKVNTLKK